MGHRSALLGAAGYRARQSGPSIVRSANAFIAAGSATLACALGGTATAGNALLWVAAMDKSPSTLTMSGTGWSTPVNLRATDVSLAASWKTAAGGETSLSGSVAGTAPPSGSRVWVAELAQSGAGAWTVLSASTNSDGTTVTSRASGTTSAITVAAALAFGLWAIDSVGSAGTSFAYTNSFTGFLDPNGALTGAGDTGEAGLWVATLPLTSGTAGSTLTRTGGTADQMSGAVLAIGRA